ncbi:MULTISPECIES: hypothetical protein [unclassified Gilliamella]|jgi:hypothetical protein|uniref:hypothetical protein n=1 Tax=unclassified Gilliamella TaxID=2685620 RepID=UPI0004DD24F3|nr:MULTISPECIES: hypothetical protein [Gilliamella]KFA58953.1 hypothetical protein GAPWKB11_0842 [Gilliamella apicola]MCO6551014.1 hypothetical protein [Gilliamella sp.]OCG56782.1 hypothetical protein A9G38_09325 [Gilliamella apicola]OCG60423.1 hypothetical protein A9G37_03685 [Gilliamella apicola]OCG64417.1 hypothetical protein A9G48_02945 [Gilliamella apicola]
MTNDNLRKVHALIQKQPWDDDILVEIQKLIDNEPNLAIKRMMAMSMSAVTNKMENSKTIDK